MNLIVTTHAAQRFQQRHAPHLSLDVAKRTIADLWPTAGKMRARSIGGQEQWQVDKPRCVLVTKRDPDGAIAVVTVLPIRAPFGVPEEDVDYLATVASRPKIAAALAKVEAAEAMLGPVQVVDRTLVVAIGKLSAQIRAAATKAAEQEASAALRAEKAARANESNKAYGDRMRAHAEKTEAERIKAKEALRALLTWVLAGEPEMGLAAVRSVEPGFLSRGFVDCAPDEAESRRGLEQAEAAIAEQVSRGGDAGDSGELDAAETFAAARGLLEAVEAGRRGKRRVA